MIEQAPTQNPGIQGYTNKGHIGNAGSNGYNIYYTPFVDVEKILSRILSSESLSQSSEETVVYREHDIIIDGNATMYTISLSGDEMSVDVVGNIINQFSTESNIQDFAPIDISIKVEHEKKQNPHYIKSSNRLKLYYRYDELFKKDVDMFKLIINDNNLTIPNDMYYTLIIYHTCGLTQRCPLQENEPVYIEHKYYDMIPDKDDRYIREKYIENCKIYLEVYNGYTNTTYRFKIDNITTQYDEHNR